MKAALFAYSKKGCETAGRIAACMDSLGISELLCYTVERLVENERGFLPFKKPTAGIYKECFTDCGALIFVSSCGIAVRSIAPYIKSKSTDPAVIVADELGSFVIPVLSGHIGGANELARRMACGIGATCVITTATDINSRFSVDAWAAQNGFAISDMKAAKRVSSAILEGDIPLKSDYKIVSRLPNGVYLSDAGALGIHITAKRETDAEFDAVLRLIPRILHIGIGCRRGTSAENIERAVDEALEKAGLDKRAVKSLASIDLKSDEEGLCEYCRRNGFKISFYSADELNSVPGEFSSSEFVKSVTGVDNVCERAAAYGGCRPVLLKTAAYGVTVAIAEEELEVNFE